MAPNLGSIARAAVDPGAAKIIPQLSCAEILVCEIMLRIPLDPTFGGIPFTADANFLVQRDPPVVITCIHLPRELELLEVVFAER